VLVEYDIILDYIPTTFDWMIKCVVSTRFGGVRNPASEAKLKGKGVVEGGRELVVSG